MTSTLSAEPAPTPLSVLKRDERGRVRVPRERQEALLDEFERSGLSGMKFAALCGVKYPSFAGWVQRRRREREGARAPVARPAPVQWMEALLPGHVSGAALVLHLPGGVRMEITASGQAPLAAAVVRALAGHTPEPAAGQEARC
jgi:hypothetical protein